MESEHHVGAKTAKLTRNLDCAIFMAEDDEYETDPKEGEAEEAPIHTFYSEGSESVVISSGDEA